MFGGDRLLHDLWELGYKAQLLKGSDDAEYVVIQGYEVPTGRFAGRAINLGIRIMPDYPVTVPSAIQVHADPQLFDYQDTVQGVRNILQSPLGPEWRYWSKALNLGTEKTTRRLLQVINKIFDDA